LPRLYLIAAVDEEMPIFKDSKEANLFFSGFFYELGRPRTETFSAFIDDKDSHSQGVNSARYEILLEAFRQGDLSGDYMEIPERVFKTLFVGESK